MVQKSADPTLWGTYEVEFMNRGVVCIQVYNT